MKPYQFVLFGLGILAAAVWWGLGAARRDRPSPVEIQSVPVVVAGANGLPPSGLPAGFQVTEEPPLAGSTVLRRVDARGGGSVAPARFEAPTAPLDLPMANPAAGSEPVTPLPAARPKANPAKSKALSPLNGAFSARVSGGVIALPAGVLEQLGGAGHQLLVSPGPDTCLWITNQPHLDRLSERLESSPAAETDIRAFRRLYFAQVERARPGAGGGLAVSARLLEFAGLAGDCVVVGIDDHFEVWDAGRWREYARRPAGTGEEQQP